MRMVMLNVAVTMLIAIPAAVAAPGQSTAIGRAAATVSSASDAGCWFRRWCGPTRCHRAFVCR